MGREMKATKERTCRTCGHTFMANAKQIKQHARICEFEKRTGLQVISGAKGIEIIPGGSR